MHVWTDQPQLCAAHASRRSSLSACAAQLVVRHGCSVLRLCLVEPVRDPLNFLLLTLCARFLRRRLRSPGTFQSGPTAFLSCVALCHTRAHRGATVVTAPGRPSERVISILQQSLAPLVAAGTSRPDAPCID